MWGGRNGQLSVFGWNICFGSYLPHDARERFHKYVYRGTDKSLLYNYLWRPLCARLVTHLPVWLSANVISVTALFLVFITHLMLVLYMPKLTAKDNTKIAEAFRQNEMDVRFNKEYVLSPPAFIFIVNAIGLLAYLVLDNLDGHQARRTHTASPLGLIIDHGCDAVNCIVIALSVGSSLSLGPTWRTWVFLLSMVSVFLMNTWEEYYIGELVLPIVNGANEGVVLGIFVYIFTAWVGGPQWWYKNGVTLPHSWLPMALTQPPQTAAVTIERYVLETICPRIGVQFFFPSTGGSSFSSVLLGLNCSDAYISAPPLPIAVRNNKTHVGFIGHSAVQNFVLQLYGSENFIWIQFNTLAIVLFAISAVITILWNLIHVYSALHQPADWRTKRLGWIMGKLRYLRVLSQLLPMVALTFFSTLWLLTSPSNIFRRHPRIFCWVFGLIFTNSSIHLMIAHVCSVSFSLLRRPLWIFFLVGVYMIFLYCCNVFEFLRHYHHRDTLFWTFASSKLWDVLFSEDCVLWFFFAVSMVAHVHLVVNVVWESASALGISVFSIPLSKQETLMKRIKEERTKK